jgi:diguanylate cyclase (GGDEF)-like protein
MISLKKYLDSVEKELAVEAAVDGQGILPVALQAYGSALVEMGNCSLNACPGLGAELQQNLAKLQANLSLDMSREQVQKTEASVQEELDAWGRKTARHFEQKAGEVKELLIAMARTAESVGARDERCAGQMNEVTARLKAIASLEDLTEIRASIAKSAAELKVSIDRMTAEGKAAMDQLRSEVTVYQAKLEAAEMVACRDALTGLGSRRWVESQIERRLAAGSSFCLAMIDVDKFKKVNDDHGHLAGDELLKQFATELRSACRSTDVVGRWGGDEFIVLLDCKIPEGRTKTDRLREWISGNYTIQGKSGARKVALNASIGVVESLPSETMKQLLARADSAMYESKALVTSR